MLLSLEGAGQDSNLRSRVSRPDVSLVSRLLISLSRTSICTQPLSRICDPRLATCLPAHGGRAHHRESLPPVEGDLRAPAYHPPSSRQRPTTNSRANCPGGGLPKTEGFTYGGSIKVRPAPEHLNIYNAFPPVASVNSKISRESTPRAVARPARPAGAPPRSPPPAPAPRAIYITA